MWLGLGAGAVVMVGVGQQQRLTLEGPVCPAENLALAPVPWEPFGCGRGGVEANEKSTF